MNKIDICCDFVVKAVELRDPSSLKDIHVAVERLLEDSGNSASAATIFSSVKKACQGKKIKKLRLNGLNLYYSKYSRQATSLENSIDRTKQARAKNYISSLSCAEANSQIGKHHEACIDAVRSKVVIDFNLSVKECGLSTRLSNSLARIGIKTTREALQLTENELTRTRGAGRKGVQELRELRSYISKEMEYKIKFNEKDFILSRSDALIIGLSLYYPGSRCGNGNIDARKVGDRKCICHACRIEDNKKQRDRLSRDTSFREKYLARKNRYIQNNRDGSILVGQVRRYFFNGNSLDRGALPESLIQAKVQHILLKRQIKKMTEETK